MKTFIENYVILPVGILCFVFISPTVMLGGVVFSFYLAGHLPDTAFCKKDKSQ
jgi:hypothetical protein